MRVDSDLWARFLRATGIWRLWGTRPLTIREAEIYSAFFRKFLAANTPEHGTAPDDYFVVDGEPE